MNTAQAQHIDQDKTQRLTQSVKTHIGDLTFQVFELQDTISVLERKIKELEPKSDKIIPEIRTQLFNNEQKQTVTE